MPEQISQELTPFKHIILSLASYAMHPKLDTLIEKLTENEKPKTRFLIKVEIKRLSKPCPYTLDFRDYFDECKPVQYQRICHHLDEISKTLFLESIKKNNGLFSFSVYNKINKHAKERHLKTIDQQNIQLKNNKIQIDPVKVFTLINDNICRDKPLNFFSQCKVFTYDPLGMSAKGKKNTGINVTLLDINPHSCILQAPMEIITAQTKVIYLWLFEHNKLLNFKEDIVLQYTVEDVKELKSTACTHYRLTLNKVSDRNMVSYLNDMLIKKNQVVNEFFNNQIPYLIDSIFAKSHEQFILAKAHDVIMLCARLNEDANEKYFPACGIHTKSNQALWDFFLTQNNEETVSKFFFNTEIQKAISINQTFDQYAFVLRHSYQKQPNTQNKVQFIVMWQNQLTSKSAKKILSKHILTGDYRYVRLRLLPINPKEDSYNPSGVPSHVHPAMALLNRPITAALNSLIKPCSHLAILSDVSELCTILDMPKTYGVKKTSSIGVKNITDEAIKCPIKYLLPITAHDNVMEIVRAGVNDFRVEDRFAHEMYITITRCGNIPCNITATTTNISIKGLAIKVDKPLKHKAGSNVLISIDIPYKNKMITLKNQMYQLVGANDSFNLRLLINQTESRHAASWMIREYIYRNMDTLKTSGFTATQTYGLERAIRNIYARNHTSVPFFIHRDKRQWFIHSVAMTEYSHINSLVIDEFSANEMLFKLLQKEKFRDYCLSVINKVNKKNPTEVFYLLVLPRHSQNNNEQTFWFNNLNELHKSNRLHETVDKIKLLGNPTILRIQLTKPNRIMDKDYLDELNYLRQLSANDADNIEAELKQVSGIGEITDHTEQVLRLIENMR